MEKIVIDILGWIGAILYLVAYGLVSAKKVDADSWQYQGTNIVAAILFIISTIYWRAYPSTGLNIAWMGIAIITLGRKYWVKK